MHRPRYNRGVSRLYSLDDANALVPDLAVVAARLRDERNELVGLRDAYRDREGVLVENLMAGEPVAGDDIEGDDPALRRLRLRMRGLVDQMQADVAWLDERGIVLRDIPSGLLDFPALVSGRQAWLAGVSARSVSTSGTIRTRASRAGGRWRPARTSPPWPDPGPSPVHSGHA